MKSLKSLHIFENTHMSHTAFGGVTEMKRALFSLTVAESKRLIAKAVVAMPEVKAAMQHGRLIVGRGSTNAYIVEELLNTYVEKSHYTVGVITAGTLCVTPEDDRMPEVVFVEGEMVDIPWKQALGDFGRGDVFIKGANAVDVDGNCGVLVGDDIGGTIGGALPTLSARGCTLIMPVGLEKLVPSVIDAADRLGIDQIDMSLGMPCGMMVVSSGNIVVTETMALEEMFDVEATHVASGGVAGSEGSVTIVVVGEDEEVKKAFEFVKRIKGEKPMTASKRMCGKCKNENCFAFKPMSE